MPFQSEAQRRYLWANEPEIARDWTDTYGSRIKKDDGGIMRVGLEWGGPGGKSPGTSSKGGTHEGGYGRSDGPPSKGGGQGDMSIRDYQEKKGDYRDRKREKLKSEVRKIEKRKEDEKKDYKKLSFTQKLKQSQINKNKVLAMRKLGLLPGWNPFSSVPEWAEGMTEAELNAIARTGPYLGADDARTAKQLESGSKLLGTVFKGGPFNTGNVNTGGGGDQPLWMQLGYPSYAAWQAAQGGTGGGGTTPPVDEESEFQQSLTGTAATPDYYVGSNPLASNIAWGKQAGVDPRTMGIYNQSQAGFPTWAAEGGRIPAAFGGIMDSSTGRRAYGLGSIFKKIGRAAKKVFKSPAGKALLLGGAGWAVNAGMLPGGAGGQWFTNMGPWQKGILLASSLPFFMGGKEEDEGSKFDYDAAKSAYADELMRIKAGSLAGTLDPNKFVYYNKGGRAGYYAGGQSVPSDYTMEDARMTSTQDKLGGITEAMKRADLYRKGSVGQMYAADGGRIGAQEGGLMDLGGMEKDYRNDGGFVPLGGEEKADDVPARLSKNEFVFTADAVRGAGGGDIDKGAEIMENVMKNLEEGGQVSDETQGLAGAQEMFGVSERLSEVV